MYTRGVVDEDHHPTFADAEDTTRDTRLGPGTDVGGFIIDGEIGKGGMGFVYSATHPVIGKRAAIKVLKPGVSKSPIILERFIQEARAVNQIGHPNIIDIFAFGKLSDGRAYHVMDLLNGESLRRRLRRGPLNPSEAASVIDETASALAAAHEKGFVHRDLKPDNVFLVELAGRWPEVKLLDFGLAKLMPEAGGRPAFQTKAGVMLGTPEYMSPEQARGVGVDYRTDVYALGVLTFEILAGVRPFPSTGDAFAMLQAHAEEPPPSIADLVPALPLELVQLVAAMLAKEPAARPSLAAVRTVIKRLRTTQLPTRTAAGLEVASIALDSGAGVRASQLGAAPVLSQSMRAHSPSQQPMRAEPPLRPSRPSQPPPSLASSQRIPGTVLGVGVPAAVKAARAMSPTSPPPALAPVQAPAPQQPPPRAASRLWLGLGALLAIAAGIAIAIALVDL